MRVSITILQRSLHSKQMRRTQLGEQHEREGVFDFSLVVLTLCVFRPALPMRRFGEKAVFGVVDNMAGSLLVHSFSFDRNRTSNTNRKRTCRRFYRYDPWSMSRRTPDHQLTWFMVLLLVAQTLSAAGGVLFRLHRPMRFRRGSLRRMDVQEIPCRPEFDPVWGLPSGCD